MADRPDPATLLWLCLGISLALGPSPAMAADAAAPADALGGEAGDTAGVGEGGDGSSGEEGGGEEEAEEPRPPLWMETYSEGVYSRHEEDNASGFTDVKIGKRFDLGRPVDIYIKARMHRDQRDFFWNNHIDAGPGVRVSLLKKAALSVYAEALGGYYYRTAAAMGDMAGMQGRIDRNRAALDAAQTQHQEIYESVFNLWNRAEEDVSLSQRARDSLYRQARASSQGLDRLDAYLDSLETTRDSLREATDGLALIPAGPLLELRAGFMFWYGSGPGAAPEGRRRPIDFPWRFWCDLYADGTFISLSRTVQTRGDGEAYRDSTARFNNFILYANPDVGFTVAEGAAGSLVAYATLYAWLDTHGDWWNNRAMAGPGLRHKPFNGFDLVLAVEYLWGSYYGRELEDDPNPYDQSFQDVRLMASFWYGLGF